jgi:3-oxoacyl-[acyl-carrier protein] reductase
VFQGHRLAELFSEKGAKVAIIDQNLEGAERVAQGIVKRGGQARAWKCDIVNGKEIRKCSEEIKKHFGKF